MLVHVMEFTSKGSVYAVGFDPHVLRQLKAITDSKTDSRFRVPR